MTTFERTIDEINKTKTHFENDTEAFKIGEDNNTIYALNYMFAIGRLVGIGSMIQNIEFSENWDENLKLKIRVVRLVDKTNNEIKEIYKKNIREQNR